MLTLLAALGHSYEKRSQFDLAAPLFLQALRVCQDPCHSAVLSECMAIARGAILCRDCDELAFIPFLG